MSLSLEAGQPAVYHNLDKLIIKGTMPSPLSFLTGIAIECFNPNGAIVEADVIDLPANQTTFSDTFVLGAPANTPEGANWISGTYTIKAWVSLENGPSVPLLLQATFNYQA